MENVIEGTSVSQYMTYIYPTPSGMAAAGGVFFLIDEQQMQQRISRALGAYEGSVFLFNSEGELLISNQTQDSHLDGTEVARTISQNGDSSFFQTEFGGDSYTVTVASSHGEDYIYAALLPVSQFDAQLEGVRNFNTLILCILLILSIVGVALITTISYRPLNKIVQTIRTAKDPAGAAKNEITLILNGIEDIQKKNAGLTHQVYSGIGYIRNYALWLLLYGHSQSVSGEIFQNLLELANIPDTQREYAVSLFKKKSSPEPDKQGAEMQYLIQYGVQDALKELVEQTDAGYCVELPDQNVTALILQVSRGQNDWKEELEETLSAILDHIQKNFQYDCYTGVGSPVALAELVQSFEQAQKALVQSVIKNLNGVQFWEEGQPAPSSFLMPLKQEIDLITAVKRGDAEACRCEMEKIVQQLKNSSFPPHTIQFIWSGLMTHLWQALGDLNITDAAPGIPGTGNDLASGRGLPDCPKEKAQPQPRLIYGHSKFPGRELLRPLLKCGNRCLPLSNLGVLPEPFFPGTARRNLKPLPGRPAHEPCQTPSADVFCKNPGNYPGMRVRG